MFQPEPDPWGFEEAPVPTFAEILQPQIPDLLLLVAFLAFAYYSFRRKSVPLKYAALVLAVGYMGFWKSSLMSITDVFRVVDMDFPVFQTTLVWYLFAGFTLVSTVLWGRFYCGRVCAFGALTQLIDAVFPARWRYEVPAGDRGAGGVDQVRRARRRARSVRRDPRRHDLPVRRAVLDVRRIRYAGDVDCRRVLLVASVFVRNLYCRFLCPLGAALGVISNLTVFRIKRWSECNTCKICQKTCEWGAIQGPDPGHRVRPLR